MTDLRRPDDEVLIAGALRGDEEALGRLLARDQEWAYNVAYRVLGQEADARDAVQDAFLQTVRALRGDGSPPRSIETYRPWLRRVVSNAAITQIRRRPAASAASADAVPDSISGDRHAEPEASIERQETRVQVLQALLSLTETQRVALALRELLDASYDEIADALDLPRTAVGTLLFRARAGFRAAYDRVSTAAPPIDCPDLVPLFAAIVDDEPRPAAWIELEHHLRACDRCQGDLEGQRRARRAYALLPLLALPVGWDPVVAALQGVAGDAVAGNAASGAQAGGSVVSGEGGTGAGARTGGAAGSTAAGSAVGSMSGGLVGGGLVAGGLGAKLTIAALATAAVVGVAVVAGPLAGLGTDSTPAASPTPALVGAPAVSPGLTPESSPAALSGSTSTPLSGPAAPASPVAPGPGTSTPPAPAVVTSPAPAAAPLASPGAETSASTAPSPAASPSPTPLPAASPSPAP